MGKMLHSNLCSLADCNKHLWQLYTHSSDCWLSDLCLGHAMSKLFKNAPNVFVYLVILSLGMPVCHHMHHRSVVEHLTTTITDAVHSSLAEVTSCVWLCVIWDEPDLNFHACAFFPVTTPTSTCRRGVGLVCRFVVWWQNYHLFDTRMHSGSTFMKLFVSFIMCLSPSKRGEITSGAYYSMSLRWASLWRCLH